MKHLEKDKLRMLKRKETIGDNFLIDNPTIQLKKKDALSGKANREKTVSTLGKCLVGLLG